MNDNVGQIRVVPGSSETFKIRREPVDPRRTFITQNFGSFPRAVEVTRTNPMKKLALFTLEGLMQQGSHHVWITLGTYSTAEQATGGAAVAKRDRQNIVETRVMPLFRDSGIASPAGRMTTSTQRTADNVTVA